MGYEESGSAVALWSEHWDPDSKPGWVIVLYSWDEYFLLSQRLSLSMLGVVALLLVASF